MRQRSAKEKDQRDAWTHHAIVFELLKQDGSNFGRDRPSLIDEGSEDVEHVVREGPGQLVPTGREPAISNIVLSSRVEPHSPDEIEEDPEQLDDERILSAAAAA